MLRGELTVLRARTEEDARILHADLYEDVATWVRSDTRPWVPVPFGTGSPYWPAEAVPSATDAAAFAVTELATGELAGEGVLWGIDLHNRSAHAGIVAATGVPRPRPRHRRNPGAVPLRVHVRGLRRMQLETLADNSAMIAVAERLGFTREGTIRDASWVNGRWVDDVVFGLLDTEFSG